MAKELKIGDPAPSFTCPANGGQTVSLSDFAKRKLVIYFYPKDNTPGCTTEAIDFTAAVKDFDKANTSIVGVSADSVKKHENFIEKHNLGITLLADEGQDMLNAYGVWVQKKMYGREFMGIERATYLIGADGKIEQIWRKVKVKGHVEAVLAAARG
ncbi:MAG: thioredoxin-dependent thiol peroxidase [PS1 clade bacterium]|nr:thioredoxin-dependent thiol peroxidase [PS1 clade bacterium]MBL6784134.1 thioredoxin-dependent thiol peroxidase [PS1 clade bacterium]